jgi:hypothetical protein
VLCGIPARREKLRQEFAMLWIAAGLGDANASACSRLLRGPVIAFAGRMASAIKRLAN